MPKTPFEYEQKRSPVVKIGLALGVVAAIAVSIVFVRQMTSGEKKARRAEPVLVAIKPLPPPPPPPPPPQVPQQRVEEQTQVTEQDMKPAEQAPDEPSPALGTGVTGNGPADGFGLGGRDRGMINGTGAGGGGGSRFGGYFNQVIQAITAALGRNPATRNAKFDIRVRVWSDVTGRVTRVRLLQSTGEAALDQALRTKAMIGCQLPDIPDGLRMPLELRLNLRRPE